MSRVININNYNEHQAFISNNDRGVIFFGSVRCPHCRSMTSTFEDLAAKYRNVSFAHVEVSKVDVDNVDGVPVFVAYKSHVPVDVVLGANKESIIKMIETKLL